MFVYALCHYLAPFLRWYNLSFFLFENTVCFRACRCICLVDLVVIRAVELTH